VNVEDLLNWLGNRLNLEWITNTDVVENLLQNPDTVSDPAKMMMPPEKTLTELLALVNLGYIKGINGKLDEILLIDPSYLAFVELMRQFSSQFQIDIMKNFIQEINVRQTAHEIK
jgi:hypothetical protein